jgi:hypothetical protein
MYHYLLLEELPTVAAVITLPDSPALRQVRIPGRGPMAQQVTLLNAALPTPAVAVAVTAGTLPMMGVG